MKRKQTRKSINATEAAEFVAWFDSHEHELPSVVKRTLLPQRDFLAANPDTSAYTHSVTLMLRREQGIVPSTERLPSGHPLSGVPRAIKPSDASKRQRLEERHRHIEYLSRWHKSLHERHGAKANRIKKKLETMSKDDVPPCASFDALDDEPINDANLTEEELARGEAAGKRFVDHLMRGKDPDTGSDIRPDPGSEAEPSLDSTNEALMQGNVVELSEEFAYLPLPQAKKESGTKVVKELVDHRRRWEFSFHVKQINIDVEKRISVAADGERKVESASTATVGPSRYSVTWSSLATLAILVTQFAMPLNRLATLLSSPIKQFTAGGLGRMLHYIAERLVPIYLCLAHQLAQCKTLAGDDTSSRVLEIRRHFKPPKSRPPPLHEKPESKSPPWIDYRNPEAAKKSQARSIKARLERQKRREEGDRDAKPTANEKMSLGVLLGADLPFESPRKDGNGPKESLNTTVVSGRTDVNDPQSLIVFYRSHLGGFGNLLEALLKRRMPSARELTVQGDLSTANFVTDPDLLSRFTVRFIGCTSHARRPFSIYRNDDPVNCDFMLHLFTGLAIHEDQLDVYGRNRHNVMAVRQNESREIWDSIKELAHDMTEKWSKATKLGRAARYILTHFSKLTSYLDDPFLAPTNNFSERMLRMEKLIEKSSMFRQTLEGRFALDIVRTVIQTAVAADVPVHEYLVWVLRSNKEDIAKNPQRFAPRAWAAAREADGEDPKDRPGCVDSH